MARKTEDLTDQKFGRLTAIGGYDRSTGITYWDFQCECGTVKSIPARSVKSGRISSCGCLKSDAMRERKTSHGMSNYPVYAVWSAMIARCTNPNSVSYMDYGGRGIKVCDRWLDFQNFFTDMGECPKGMSIDRKDVNGDYEPGNCRWATRHEQNMNRRNTMYVEYGGERVALFDLAKSNGVDYDLLRGRYYRGWPLDVALTAPVGTRLRGA